jgi:prenyltransferase beta subunit
MNMEYTQITRQVLDLQKMSFANWYDAVAMLQDQATTAMDMVLDQNTWMPEEGRKAIQSWVSACQQERGRFKSYIDEGFAGLEKIVAEGKRAVQPKPKKQEG